MPSDQTARKTIKIRPLCNEGDSIYFADNLVSDLKYDRDTLLADFKAVVEKYGFEQLTATKYDNLGLMWYMAHHGGTTSAGTGTSKYYTGQELGLRSYIAQQGQVKKIAPDELFAKALEMNQGDVTKALLTCHNVLRAAKSGKENFSDQLSAEDEKLLATKNEDYKKLSKEQLARRGELESIAGIQANTDMYRNLEDLRPGDENNMGAWYHFLALRSFLSAPNPVTQQT